MVKLRYDAEEKYRNDSINQVKEERQKIIEESEEKKMKKKKHKIMRQGIRKKMI